MDGNIDKVREAIEGLLEAANHNVGGMVPGVIASWCHEALSTLSAIDPDEIRRECAYKAKQAILSAPYDNPTRAYAAALAEAAIFSASTAPDDRLKPLNYDDENPCASCRADDPSDCEKCETTDPEHVDSEWKPKPAQDDGEPELFSLSEAWDAFESGYMQGYNDTVESCVRDSKEAAMDYFSDVKRRIEEARE